MKYPASSLVLQSRDTSPQGATDMRQTPRLSGTGTILVIAAVGWCVILGAGCVVVHSGHGPMYFATQGSGVVKTEQRQVKEFRRIRLDGSAKVNVTIGQ